MRAGPQRDARVLITDANARERTGAGGKGVVKVAAGEGEYVQQGFM
jgi:hypothetical protein